MTNVEKLLEPGLTILDRISIAGGALLGIARSKEFLPDANHKKRTFIFELRDSSTMIVRPEKITAGDDRENRKPVFSDRPTMLRGFNASTDSFYLNNGHVTLENGRPENPMHVWSSRSEQGANMVMNGWLTYEALVIDYLRATIDS